MEVMMILGPYVFGLNTAAFQELNRNTEWRWPGQDVFQDRPALQFAGWGEDTITLPGVIFPEYWGGTGQLNELRALGDEGEPQILIDGRGNVMGEWVITGVSERQSTFAAAGTPLRQEFTVSLKRYDSVAGTAADASGGDDAGDADALGGIAGAVSPVAGLASTVSSALAAAGRAVGALTAIQSTVTGAVAGAVGTALNAATGMQSAALQAVTQVTTLGAAPSLASATAAVSGLLDSAGNTALIATAQSGVIGAIASGSAAQLGVNSLAVAATNVRAQVQGALGGFI